jgi:HK97 family phage prohead protease
VTVPDPTTFETRTVSAEFEMRDDSATGAPVIEGYASVFNQPYDMGPFWEQVDQRAFDRTLAGKPDVRLLIDHEGQPLARTKSGTLTLSTDSTGLRVHAPLDPSDPDVQRLIPKMRRGDLDQMSFAFRVPAGGDEWDYSGDRTMRTLNELNLSGGDVSVVTYPASPTTSASVRARDLHEARCVFVEQMAREMRAGNPLSSDNLAKLQSVLSELAPAVEPEPLVPEAPVVEESQQRGMSPDTARRLLAAADAALA